MILKEYLCSLAEFVNEHPEALDFPVIYSKDDEGNGFQEVYFTLTIGIFDKEDGEFLSNKEDYEEEYETTFKPNAVCVN